MADVISTSNTLKIENLFVDGDTRTQTLKNPKSNITTQDIENLQSFMRLNNIIKGDKYGGTFAKIQSVKRETTTKVDLDFT